MNVLIAVVATLVAAAAVRSWWVGRWVARALSKLSAVPCPQCRAPLGPAAGHARSLGMFDVVVTCDGCGAAALHTLTPAGPVTGATLPTVAKAGRPSYPRLTTADPDGH